MVSSGKNTVHCSWIKAFPTSTLYWLAVQTSWDLSIITLSTTTVIHLAIATIHSFTTTLLSCARNVMLPGTALLDIGTEGVHISITPIIISFYSFLQMCVFKCRVTIIWKFTLCPIVSCCIYFNVFMWIHFPLSFPFIHQAGVIFEKGTKVNYTKVEDLAGVWCEWAEMELRRE